MKPTKHPFCSHCGRIGSWELLYSSWYVRCDYCDDGKVSDETLHLRRRRRVTQPIDLTWVLGED